MSSRKIQKQHIVPPRPGLEWKPISHRWIRREQPTLAEYLSSKEHLNKPLYSPKEHRGNGFKVSPKQQKTLAEYLEERGFHKSLLEMFSDFVAKQSYWEIEQRGKTPPQGIPSKAEDKSGYHRLLQDPANADHNARGMRPRTAVEQIKEYNKKKRN